MTKFQFHVLIALGFLILASDAIGIYFHVYWLLVYIFSVFAVFDAVKVAREEVLKERHSYNK